MALPLLLIEIKPSFHAVPASTYFTVPWVGSSYDQNDQWSKNELPDQVSFSCHSELYDVAALDVAAAEEEVAEACVDED
jgi:hypothetical protein